MNGGVYIAVFWLERARRIRIGRLGESRFPAGIYFYVGSAQRNLDARLARHGRRKKPLRWHIDYLSAKATMLGAIIFERPRDAECQIAAELAQRYGRPIGHFGDSDCRCGGHLFHSPQKSH